jgi:hypothetical protein
MIPTLSLESTLESGTHRLRAVLEQRTRGVGAVLDDLYELDETRGLGISGEGVVENRPALDNHRHALRTERLDEVILSPENARRALEIKACRIVDIKVGASAASGGDRRPRRVPRPRGSRLVRRHAGVRRRRPRQRAPAGAAGVHASR